MVTRLQYRPTISALTPIGTIFPDIDVTDWTIQITNIALGTSNQGDKETVNYRIQKLDPAMPNKILVKMTIQNYSKNYTTEVFDDVYGEYQHGNFTPPVNTNTYYRYIDTTKLAGYCSILIELFKLDGTKIMERRFLNKFKVQTEEPIGWLEME